VRYPIRTALAHIGRGVNSDVRLTDESVSEIHAKLQRRGDGWYAVDMNSTNGTWVDGSRITGERRLEGAPDIRFGGVKLRFIPAGMSEEALNARPSRQTPAERQRAGVTTDPRQAAASPQGGTSKLIWVLLVALVAVAAFFVLRGRA
jgi:pSer/pThr/pTyr-binding forkhead associated (FHA) protein